ncbi:unnamed protein product, partial [Ectocarpus sp. 13 AM-2016]
VSARIKDPIVYKRLSRCCRYRCCIPLRAFLSRRRRRRYCEEAQLCHARDLCARCSAAPAAVDLFRMLLLVIPRLVLRQNEKYDTAAHHRSGGRSCYYNRRP